MVTQDISHIRHDPWSQAETQECTQSFKGEDDLGKGENLSILFPCELWQRKEWIDRYFQVNSNVRSH